MEQSKQILLLLLCFALFIGIYLLLRYYISSKMEYVAVQKGYHKEAHAFLMCFCFGIIGYIYVAMLPDKVQQSQNQQLIELLKNIENTRT